MHIRRGMLEGAYSGVKDTIYLRQKDPFNGARTSQ